MLRVYKPAAVDLIRICNSAKMSTFKLIYFPARGRAELSRFIFAYAGIQYEQVVIPFEKWSEHKPNMPFGCLPVMEYDGRVIGASCGIARYLAERFRLAGSTSLENAELFAIVDSANSVWDKIYLADFYEKDEARKLQLRKVNNEQHIPDMLSRYERIAAKNNAPEGWMWGEKVTYADFAVYMLMEHGVKIGLPVADDYPTLAKLKESVENIPSIAKWLKERPVTEL